MLNLKKIAVTGGIACGKTIACRFFRELGAYVVSADEIVHKLLSINSEMGRRVIQLVGSDVVVNQQIDRSQIAKKVFTQPQLLQALENLLHPAVREEIERQYQKVKKEQSASLFIAEVPLLYETHGESAFDKVIVVFANPKISQERFVNSTGYDASEFQRRSKRQLSPEQKAKMADYVINNEGTLGELRLAVHNLYNNLEASG